MLHADEFPDDQDPTGHAAHTADDGAATTEDMEPAEHGVQREAPEREYAPAQQEMQPVLPRLGW